MSCMAPRCGGGKPWRTCIRRYWCHSMASRRQVSSGAEPNWDLSRPMKTLDHCSQPVHPLVKHEKLSTYFSYSRTRRGTPFGASSSNRGSPAVTPGRQSPMPGPAGKLAAVRALKKVTLEDASGVQKTFLWQRGQVGLQGSIHEEICFYPRNRHHYSL